MLKGKRVLFFLLLSLSSSAWAATEVRDWAKLRERFGLRRYYRQDSRLKIAILDNGFLGFDPKKQLLPNSAELIPSASGIPPLPSSHGLAMAQILWSMTAKDEAGPHFYLLNTNGFTNLKAAIQFVVDQGIHIVLYSQVWTFGGNLDGTGFINALVQRALDAGVIWINAAGNQHLLTYNGPIAGDRLRDDFLALEGRGYLRFENKYDDNSVEVTLSWTDFRDDPEYSTRKDLDLFVTNSNGETVGSSTLIQRGEAPTEKDAKLSSHAREVVQFPRLERGHYRIWVKDSSKNFTAKDRLRIHLKDQRNGIVFTDHTESGEILPPADHPGVFTVGDLSSQMSSVGPTADGRIKPDVLIADSKIEFTNNETTEGSSNAAALFAGIVAALKMEYPGLNAEILARYLREMRQSAQERYASTYTDLEGAKAGPLAPRIAEVIPPGSVLMRSRVDGHRVILTPQDPFSLVQPTREGIVRNTAGSALFYTPLYQQWWEAMQGTIYTPEIMEFRQMNASPADPRIWQTPVWGDLLRL